MIDLNNISDQFENEHLEAKSAKGGFPDSFWETYSAFANSDGGVILLGVEERSDHSLYLQDGLPDAEKTKEAFWKLVNNRQKISHNVVTQSMVYIAHIEQKDILVVEVPRVERTTRPVYKGLDPRLGTYRRWGSGDHLCSPEEVTSMLRDASPAPLDAQVIPNMPLSVFCEDTVNAYRNVFKSTNPHHLWNNLNNEVFLRRINAIAMGNDGLYHPTEAGLLMFGYEYDIITYFPLYFLDYQEDRVMIGATRWKDRITSNSGDWSGNLFDFFFKVLPKMQADLKIPFIMKGNQRVDDTPLHKVLREAMVNALSNADFRGRRGVVISKNNEGFSFANPGNMRISKTEAIEGGVSDPRNSTILKFFSLIHFGERAGSGLSGIMHIWKSVYHTQAEISEAQGSVDRTILSLHFNGNELDTNAMLQLYDNTPDRLVISHNHDDDSTKASNHFTDKTDLSRIITDKLQLSGIITDKARSSEIITDIYIFIATHPHSSTEVIANHLGRNKESIKKYIRSLVTIKMVKPEGANKNRTYSALELL